MVTRKARGDSPEDARSAKRKAQKDGAARLSEDEMVGKQLGLFLDEWYYRILHSSIAHEMDRPEALRTFLNVLEILGVQFPGDDKKRIALMEEQAAIAKIVERMPTALRQKIEHVTLQLQTVVYDTTRLRQAAELQGVDADETVKGALEECGNDSVKQQILKSAVVLSTKNATKLRRLHTSWQTNTDARIERMTRSQEEAEKASQELLALESQLADLSASQKGVGKSVLLKMAHGQDVFLKSGVFISWRGLSLKKKGELDIRRRLEDRIAASEKNIFQYKERQIQTVRSVLVRIYCEETEAALRDSWCQWVMEVHHRKADGDSTQELKKFEAQLTFFEKSAVENAKKVMVRMAGSHDGAIVETCFKAWQETARLWNQERLLEDAAKRTGIAMKKNLDAKHAGTRHVMERMTGSCASGLKALVIQYWVEVVAEEKNSRAMEAAVFGEDQRFKALNKHHRAGAANVQSRVNQQVTLNFMQRLFSHWSLETKVHSINHFFSQKYNTKKKQLHGVQNLFKSFATQLEQNLGADDDEPPPPPAASRGPAPSGREVQARDRRSDRHQHESSRHQGTGYPDPRQHESNRHTHRSMVRSSAASSSLPDIHSRGHEMLV